MLKRDEIIASIKKAAPEGKLSCAMAWQLAEEFGVSKKEIGDLANDLKIKIKSCQLGCF